MVQITGQYRSPDIFKYSRTKSDAMCEIHITILPTKTKEAEPLCITLPEPKLDSSYNICYEIQKLLSNNRSDLEATYANNELYWKMREKQNTNMKVLINDKHDFNKFSNLCVWICLYRLLYVH